MINFTRSRQAFLACLIVAHVILLGTALKGNAQTQEETVNLGGTGTEPEAPAFNPYDFERSKVWLVMPGAVLVYLLLHFSVYPYVRVKRKNFLETLPSSNQDVHEDQSPKN